MSQLIHIIYVSRAEEGVGKDDIINILKIARDNNEKLGITGMLLFDGSGFFQVLEGEKTVLENLFKKLANDKRHSQVIKLIEEEIPERAFQEWTMGYSEINKKEMNATEGMNDFFQGKECLVDLDQGRAKKLLVAYSDGRWRLA